VERPLAQKSFPRSKQFLIYSLGSKGKELLSRETSGKRGNEVGFPYLAHAMMISQFRTALTLALRARPDSPKIERWCQGYELKDMLAPRGQSLELVPDAYLTLKDGEDMLDFFLEADMSTMTRERFLDKMKTYWKWYREKRFQKTLGIGNFRVLTITKSEERAENLRKIAKNADDRKTGSNMFLFLSETQYSLVKPEAVLSPAWVSAKDEKHSIIE
jgi:hypothetical protein